jgi:hypothetical protein
MELERSFFRMGQVAELASHLRHSLHPLAFAKRMNRSLDSTEKKEKPASITVVQRPADEISSPVTVPQTFWLPQRLIDDLVRAGELRASSWSDQEGNTWLST